MEDELVRRVRAARGYAGLSQPALADALGVSKDTLARLERGERDLRGFERDGFVRAVADATGLPYDFFLVDFDELPSLMHGPGAGARAAELAADHQRLAEATELLVGLSRQLAIMWRTVPPEHLKAAWEEIEAAGLGELDDVVRPIEDRAVELEREEAASPLATSAEPSAGQGHRASRPGRQA